MARLRPNFQYGTITNNPLTIGATNPQSAAFANLPAVVAPDYLVLEVDPKSVIGLPEIMYVTAHTASSTTVTVTRAQEGTAARSHSQNEVWICGPSGQDFSATSAPSTSGVGDSASIGTTDAFALANHTHARESWAVTTPSSVSVGSGSTGSLPNPAHHDHNHPVTPGSPSASSPTDTGSTGSGPLSAGNHQHPREGFGVPLGSAVGDRAVQGTGPAVAAFNHVHTRESAGTPPGTSYPSDNAAQGSGPAVAYYDHKHDRENYGGLPTRGGYGDVGTAGALTTVSRGDHGHPHTAPTATFGHMDNTSPVFGPHGYMATVSGYGPPMCGPITVPASGIMVINWSICPVTFSSFATDIYIGVGWSTNGGVTGSWGGSSIGSPGTGAGSNYSVMSATTWDNTTSGSVSGTWYISDLYWNLNPGTAYYFYMLWGSQGTAVASLAGSRAGAANGTWLEVITVP